ncbi:hypothetical protein GGX14DRAFT_384582 [Mycena pura]|uniref:Uncharacterized protein n=1 Tax=Mycena pura TaxID=153505 RepID=A0AAD6YWM3_9AGAR|nr:hypothetical protein GGX14DRAFT_384582 [Mycena pura]
MQHLPAQRLDCTMLGLSAACIKTLARRLEVPAFTPSRQVPPLRRAVAREASQNIYTFRSEPVRGKIEYSGSNGACYWVVCHGSGTIRTASKNPFRISILVITAKKMKNSDLDGDSDSDSDSDQSDQECSQREDTLRPVAEQVPAGDTAAADDSGAAAESDYDDEKVKELRRRLTRAKRAVRKKGKKSTVTVETHTKFVVDEDIDMRAPGLKVLKALLTDATPDSVARTKGDIIDVDGHMDVDCQWNDEAL